MKSRNRAVTLLSNIKGELKKGYPLQKLGLNASSWNNVGLNEFLSFPEEHYQQIIKTKPRRKIPKRDLIRHVAALYTLFGKHRHLKIGTHIDEFA